MKDTILLAGSFVSVPFIVALGMEQWNEHTIEERLRSGKSIPEPVFPDLTNSIINRDEELKQLHYVFEEPAVMGLFYLLLQGPHAQGKTTLVQQALRDGLAESKGVIFVDTPNVGTRSAVALAIGRSMNYDPNAFYRAQWPMLLFFRSLLQSKPPSDDLEAYLNKLVELAKRFKAKHGRELLLVFDNVNWLAKKDPEALDNLKGFAKTMADRRLIRVVFVTSDGEAPKLLSQGNASRMKTIEMRDSTLDQARTMLHNAAPQAAASLINKIVCELTGGRIGYVVKASQELIDSYRRNPRISNEELFDAVGAVIESSELGGRNDPMLATEEAHKLAKALLKKHDNLPPGLRCDVVNNATLTMAEANALLKTNHVLELCSGNMFWLRDNRRIISFQSAIAARVMKDEVNTVKNLDRLDDVLEKQKSKG